MLQKRDCQALPLSYDIFALELVKHIRDYAERHERLLPYGWRTGLWFTEWAMSEFDKWGCQKLDILDFEERLENLAFELYDVLAFEGDIEKND